MIQKVQPVPRWLRNSLLFPLFFLNGWLFTLLIAYLQPMVTLVLLAIILAFVLDFPIQFLQRRGLLRLWSVVLVVLGGLALLLLLGVLVIPVLIQQTGDFLNLLPQWASTTNGLFEQLSRLPASQILGLDFTQLEAQLTSQLGGLLRTIGSSLLGILIGGFSGGLKAFFVFVLTVFMLTKGAKAWEGMMGWLSPWWRERLEMRVPFKVRRFIGGQIILATGFAVVLAVIFSIIKVPLALVFACLIGLGSLFPFMGAIVQTSVSLFLMIHNLGIGLQVFVIALVLGQILDEVILPKFMGDLVGVNPIWLIISVFIGAKLGGVVGILVAVPVASIIKELVTEIIAASQPAPNPPLILANPPEALPPAGSELP
ncbi:MAG: AI-2E family transporter [Nodosilinea sp.]